jgi:site-specific DNA recombinase
MEVALYARVSTSQQPHEGTIESQRRALKHHMQHHGWSLLPEHAYSDDGISGARLDRPALDRLHDAVRGGAFAAVVLVSPDRLARHDAHPWLLIEACEKLHTPLLFLQPPCGESPQGKLLPQMPGMIAEYERAQNRSIYHRCTIL